MPFHHFAKEYNKECFVQFADSASIDAFGRARISAPTTLFDSKQIHDNQPLFWDDAETSGGGTASSHSTAKASTTISVSASTAGVRTRQTFQHFNYQPGKSQLVMMTFQITGAGTGITASLGIFNTNNGIFFSSDDGVNYFVIRSKVTGSIVDNPIAQSDWNIDKMNGFGPSGVNLDVSKTNIVVIDYEWLGVGRVRVGFNIDGHTYYVHEFLHANIESNVYMSSPNLPLKYSIANDGSGGAASMQHICSTVISEGSRHIIGLITAVSNGTTEVTATNANTYYALQGLKLQSGHVEDQILLENVNVMITSVGVFEWQLRFNPTVAGTFTYSNLTNSAVAVATGVTANNNTVTNGYIIGQGYGASAGTGQGAGAVGQQLQNALTLGWSIAGVADSIVLCVASPTAGETFLGGITFRELS